MNPTAPISFSHIILVLAVFTFIHHFQVNKVLTVQPSLHRYTILAVEFISVMRNAFKLVSNYCVFRIYSKDRFLPDDLQNSATELLKVYSTRM